jgi:hypothetical protein
MTLEPLIDRILHESNPGALKAACDELYRTLGSLVGLADESTETDEIEPSHLAGGKAIAPRDAARCVLDFARTTQFMRGVSAAVAEAQRRFRGQTVDVLYAGCGPFAPLALPLVMMPAAALRITLLDVHGRSLRAARQIFERIGALDRVGAFVECDASEYTVDPARPPHVVVIEAMQRALTREPQVAITRNLAPQLVPGGLLVPERITVSACLANPAKEYAFGADGPEDRGRVQLATLMVLSGDAIDPGTPVVVEVPADVDRYQLQLTTTIRVHGGVKLADYDAGVTMPMPLAIPAGARRLEFVYQMGKDPRWVVIRSERS